MNRKYKNEINYFLYFILFISIIIFGFRILISKEYLTTNVAATARSTTPQYTSEPINATMGNTLLGKIFPEKINPNISLSAYNAITQANKAITNANKAIYDAQLAQSRAQARLDSQNAAIKSSNITMTNEFNQHYTDQQNSRKT